MPIPSAARASLALPRPGQAFLDSLVHLNLLDVHAIPGFLKKYEDRLGEFHDPGLLGEALVQMGVLTEYQLSRILAGTTHGLVLGAYKVLDRLGGGSVGVVFLAEHILLRRRVAVKVVPVDDGFPQSVLERFYAEMRLLAGLNHRHIVHAYDAGRLRAPSPNLPALHYLVMELLTGGDLENYVVGRGPASIAQGCEWGRQAAAGLQEAHDHHLVHRDLKPSNLLLTTDREVKLVDFGLARQFYSNKTDPRALIGSIEFMAPEQSRDPTAVNARADIFGLGATLFWVLCCQTPYPQEQSIAKALKALQTQTPRRLREFLPEAPRELDDLLARMMARDPAARPPTPLSVMPVLARFAATARPEEIGPTAPPPNTTTPTSKVTLTDEPALSTRRVLLAGGPEILRQSMRETLEAVGCACTESAAGADALRELNDRPYDLALLDLALENPGAYEICRKLREQPPRPHLVTLVHGQTTSADELAEAILQGADDLLPHPLDLNCLAAKVQHALRVKDTQDWSDQYARQLMAVNQQLKQSLAARVTEVRRTQDALLYAMAKMAESRDGETAGHLRRVQQYAVCLAEALHQSPEWRDRTEQPFLDQLRHCTPLHDIGKLGVPDAILSKAGPLTPDERRVMQAQTTLGSFIIDAVRREHGESFEFLATARSIVRHHHERFDGAGYPDRLAGEAIPAAARIVAVADVYDALRRQRPHKPPMPHEAAVRTILHESPGAFDPKVVQ
ncbi:MAG TPA: protein kinase, partial [Gemmataceae bacterium]|nr:protein kinase [Gemmataceae bacterium]